LSIALVGAGRPAPPKASPTPKPVPSAAPTPAVPVIVVYPFSGTGDIKSDTGLKAAQLFEQQIRQAGGVTVVDGSAGVARTNFPTDATKQHADYYLSGYMTVLGDAVALVEQLVSVQSGTIVFSNTAQIQNFNDAAAQAQAVHDAILADQKRFTGALNDQPAASASTPTPLPNSQVNIGGLFKHKARATAAPKATPVQKPAKGIFVVRITGNVGATDLTAGTQTLSSALDRHYLVKMADAAAGGASKNADKICGSQRDNTIATGDVTTSSVKHGFFSKTQYAFTLHVYTCFGAQLAQSSGTGSSLGDAITAAVQSYASAHPTNS
jgi:TolB-like protein